MRSISVKQQPNVNFTYQSSPTKITSYNYTHHHTQPDIIINKKSINNPSITNKTTNHNNISHIKIVQIRDQQSKRDRRHKIFQEVGNINRLSKSKERNKSYSIFNGVPHYSTNKIKDLVYTKQSCKEQSVQTENIAIKQAQTKISTFNPSPPKPTPHKSVHQRQSPLHIQHISHQVSNNLLNDSNSQRLQQQLKQKQREVLFLKLELQRYERCDKLTLQNQSIYKRLVQKLDQINYTASIKENNQPAMLQTKNKIGNSPPLRDATVHPSQTTRFLYPSAQKKYSNQKQSIGSIISQVNNIKNLFQQSPPKISPNNDQIKTITFQKTHHNKIIKKQHTKYPSPFTQQNQSFNIMRSQYGRNLTNTIDFNDLSVYDRLSSMNRQLQSKVVLRSELQNRHGKYKKSDMMRGRSISSSVGWEVVAQRYEI